MNRNLKGLGIPDSSYQKFTYDDYQNPLNFCFYGGSFLSHPPVVVSTKSYSRIQPNDKS